MEKIVSVNVNCPHCNKSLMDNEYLLNGKPSIKVNIEAGEKRGIIRLCSIYGSYDHQSDMDMSFVDIAEFSCPHCNKLLKIKEICDRCGAPLLSFFMVNGGKVTICSRNGCKKHYVAFEDVYESMRKFYSEYGF